MPVLVIMDESEYDELMMIRLNNMVIRPVGIDGSSTERVLRVISKENHIPALEIGKKISYAVL